jgi:hypothetical protein
VRDAAPAPTETNFGLMASSFAMVLAAAGCHYVAVFEMVVGA